MYFGRFVPALLLTGFVPLEIPETPSRGTAAPLPSIRDIMQEAHRCRTAYILTVRQELQKDQPNWDVVRKKSTDLVRMGNLLGLNKPPRGSAESWSKLTGLYVAHATLMADAAERTDKETANRHQLALSRMCIGCHREHR